MEIWLRLSYNQSEFLKKIYFIQCEYAQHISHQQIKCILSTATEILAMNRTHDVRILVDEFEEFFQAPEETLHATQYRAYESIVVLLQFMIQILQTDPNHATDGDD